MITYRQAAEADYQHINDFHNRIYASNRTLEAFYWEFHLCPDGSAVYVIGEDGDRIVGTNCVIPIKLVTADGAIVLTGKSEDTLVDPEYRGQNIFNDLYAILFERCKENGITVIWGFTSAHKPFSKLGFDIPYSHIQSLAVNQTGTAYRYLSGLNPSNNRSAKLKIAGLCLLSRLKSMGRKRISVVPGYTIRTENSIAGVDELIRSNLGDASFAILQSPAFQTWRIYENPHYKNVRTFSFYAGETLKGLLVANIAPGNIAFVCQSSFHASVSQQDASAMVGYMTDQLFRSGVAMIRNWHFTHTSVNRNEVEAYKNASYKILDKGIGFVWKKMLETDLESENFQLSRIATEGLS